MARINRNKTNNINNTKDNLKIILYINLSLTLLLYVYLIMEYLK